MNIVRVEATLLCVIFLLGTIAAAIEQDTGIVILFGISSIFFGVITYLEASAEPRPTNPIQRGRR